MILRDGYYLKGLNCDPFLFDEACEKLNIQSNWFFCITIILHFVSKTACTAYSKLIKYKWQQCQSIT